MRGDAAKVHPVIVRYDLCDRFAPEPSNRSGVERGVNAHSSRGCEELHDEAVLHQRLAAAHRQSARHDLQAMAVLAQFVDRLVTATGMPLVIFQVSGLWQYRQRNLQPAVHATTRTPGPSTADPVVNECRKPMSPVSSAAAHVGLRNIARRGSTRRSNGLVASSGAPADGRVARQASTRRSVERAVDHVHLLLAGQAHEVHRVAGDADREARIFLRMIHRVEQRLAIETLTFM